MLSFHLTGSPWFLLLLLPGGWLLWRQYASGGAAPRERLLLALQGAALFLLVASLTAPELRRHSVRFHDPAILILRDRSGSFRGGDYLGLGPAYARVREALEKEYSARKFRVVTADFDERARFSADSGKFPAAAEDALTDFSAAADFVDSSAGTEGRLANLQAVFLFSDGRGNADSGKTARRWKAPVFPVVLPSPTAEMQPEGVNLSVTPGKGGTAEVSWRRVGKPPREAVVRLLYGGRVAAQAKVPAADTGDPAPLRIAWTPDKDALESKEGWRATLQPAGEGENFDAWNDTLAAVWRDGGAGRRIFVMKPVRSLDEKGMLEILYGWDGAATKTVDREELAKENPGPGDEVWAEAGAFFSDAALAKLLGATPARLVLYARAEGAALPGGRGVEMSPGAAIEVARAADEFFPDGVARLQGLAAAPVTVPAAGSPWRPAATLTEGSKRGVLMGRYPLKEGKTAFFFSLPSIWKGLFDPQADFAARENVTAYVKAAAQLAEREEGAVRVSRPARPCHFVPFDVEISLPAADSGKIVLAVDGPRRVEPPLKRSAADAWRAEGLALPQGRYRLELRRDGAALWSDSLEVIPKAALELSRIGFDRAYLSALAAQSGGALIDAAAPDEVTRKLPTLAAAQARAESARATRLYNTRAMFLAVLLLLGLSWVLRKRWDLD